jgi:hydantoinase/carbamoylase family amidase
MPHSSPIKLSRVLRRLRDFNRIGVTAARPRRGITRLAYTDADLAAKAVLVDALRALGAVVYCDAIGNIFGLSREYREKRPLLLVGSHLDTVAGGGRYDGTLGVVAGLEMLHLQREGEIPPDIPLGVVCFACEEAARFGRATLGSSYLAGALPRGGWATIAEASAVSASPRNLAKIVRDADVRELLVRGDKAPDTLFSRSREDLLLESPHVATYLELHIEQGPILEREALEVGLISTITAPSRLRVTVSCEQGHSGTTPMNMRKNIFSSAMAIYDRFHEYCSKLEDQELAWTLIGIQTPSAQWGMVPGNLTMDIEIRSTRKGRKRDCQRELARIAKREASRAGVVIPLPEVLSDAAPTRLDRSLRIALEKTARRLQLRYKIMPSLAGHDAANMARICRSGMIFVPCKGGMSHHWAERIDLQDAMPGLRLLLELLREGTTG